MMTPDRMIALAGVLVTLAIAAPAAVRWLRREHEMRQAVEAKLYGRPAVLDRNGEVIAPAVHSVSEEIAALRKDVLSRPALNGEWEDALTLIAEIHAGQRLTDVNVADLRRKVEALSRQQGQIRLALKDAADLKGDTE